MPRPHRPLLMRAISITLIFLIFALTFNGWSTSAHNFRRPISPRRIQVASTPTISQITPNQINAGTTPKKIIIDGSGFQTGAKVEINGTQFSAKLAKQNTRLTLKSKTLPAMLFQQPGNLNVVVVNPDGGRSATAIITILGSSSGARINFANANPVVNENSTMQLAVQVLDAQGNVVNGANLTFESGSPDIAKVDNTGLVTGVLQGFATITARSNNISGSVNLAVTRVSSSPMIDNQGMGEIRVDLKGNVYVTDLINHVLRRGKIDTKADLFAGAVSVPGNLDGMRLDARLNGPLGLTIDNSSGFIYIADSANHVIRRLAPNGQVITIAGTTGQAGSDDGSFQTAKFNNPLGVAIDRGGNLYVSDTNNNTIRFLDMDAKTVRTIAGAVGQPGLLDGKGTAARFANPQSLVIAESQTGFFGANPILLISDTGNKVIRRLNIGDTSVTTIGPIQSTLTASGKGIAPLAPFTFNNPTAIGRDDAGDVYVCDNGKVRVISPDGDLFDLAGDNTFANPTGVATLGATAFVLDGSSANQATLKTITVGAPVINSVSPNTAPVQGGVEVIIDGKNFSSDTRVLFDGIDAQMLVVESATRLRLLAPTVNGSGLRTLTVFTRGGVAQQAFFFMPFSLGQIANGAITTIAGGTNFVGDGGNALSATLGFPQGLAVDAAGKLLIADTDNQRVRRVDIASGMITSIVGTGNLGGDANGINALTANLSTPTDVVLDSEANIYTTNFNTVVKLEVATRKLTTIAGNGDFGEAGDGGQATKAQLGVPLSIAFDSNDNLYIADANFNRIRRVDANTGIITTIAGQGSETGGFGGDGGPAINAQISAPSDISIDLNGNIYFTDLGNQRVRRIDASTKQITTVAGNGESDFSGDGGLATMASLSDPLAVAIDNIGNIFIADSENHRIRKVDVKTGIITTVAGRGDDSFDGDGGNALQAALSRPNALVLDGVGNLFIADGDNNRVRMVDSVTGIITTVAGTGALDFSGEGVAATRGRLFFPDGILLDSSENLIISDSAAGRIRQFNTNSQLISTIAGSLTAKNFGDDGPAIEAFISLPTDLTFDNAGNLLFADTNAGDIRLIESGTGTIRHIAGNRDFGFSGDGGDALNATFAAPTGVAVDKAGNIFIADTLNNRVRRIDAQTNIITTVVGTGEEGFDGDGEDAADALLSEPTSLAFDSEGNLYIGDYENFRLRRVDAQTNIITTVAGTGDPDFSGDGGPATEAAITGISDIIFDRQGNIYIADQFNNCVRRIDIKTGIIDTVAGNGDFNFTGDGGDAKNAALALPSNLAIDRQGNLYISDQFNNAIRIVKGIAR